MIQSARRMYDWAASKAGSSRAPLWLGLLFLLELVLFIPFDALLMFFCMQNPRRRFLYASVAAVASLVTGVFGFFVGFCLWEAVGSYVVGHLISESFFAHLVSHYGRYEQVAVVVGSLLPFPFKAVTLSAGFCHLPFWPFVGSVLFARVLRFFLVAQVMHIWGGPIKAFIERYFGGILIAFGIKIALVLIFFWALGS